MKIKRNYYKEITDQVIDLMTKHKENWFKPFQVSTMNGHHNLKSKKCYQGLNCFQIGMSVYTNGFKSNEWATYKQWFELGGGVKEGKKIITPSKYIVKGNLIISAVSGVNSPSVNPAKEIVLTKFSIGTRQLSK